MTRKYTKWTKETLSPIVKESTSYAQCLEKMGLVNAGGNYANLQRNIDKYNLDARHFTGQAHNAGKEIKPFDSNNRNNSRENLKLLCPNCHAQTPTYRNRTRCS
jgi:5-methylcytosine-specific restriction endonuclease McrA